MNNKNKEEKVTLLVCANQLNDRSDTRGENDRIVKHPVRLNLQIQVLGLYFFFYQFLYWKTFLRLE